jgi:hypothetical protein
MGFSRKRQSILVGLAKVCVALAPNMQSYFYRIDRKLMGTKWSRTLSLLLYKEKWGLLKGLDSMVAVRRKEVRRWGGVWGKHERGTEQRRARPGHGVSSAIGSRWRAASSGVAVHPPESRGSAQVLGLTG